MVYVVDTHSFVWFLEDNPRLGAQAKTILSDPGAHLVIPTIVLAEIVFLYARKRIGVDVQSVLSHVVRSVNCVIYPLDQTVVEFLPTELDIHDAIIVATAKVFRDVLGEEVRIITKNAQIAARDRKSVV